MYSSDFDHDGVEVFVYVETRFAAKSYSTGSNNEEIRYRCHCDAGSDSGVC